jgi:hypothetical protein
LTETTSTSIIVAGVDGSDSSADALCWAADQARLTGADLHAVYVWDFPSAYGWAWAPGFTMRTTRRLSGGDHPSPAELNWFHHGVIPDRPECSR